MWHCDSATTVWCVSYTAITGDRHCGCAVPAATAARRPPARRPVSPAGQRAGWDTSACASMCEYASNMASKPMAYF